ncbi:MAG: GNAT family N-acetyltransferase [Firmicutes bacterium HGW-Firmicutes-1]|jgi:ribosomal-protein-alanine N-acetyltransferase|nr:MAG: GNAT family N-acetyltransferase [Firmicutes bacterium HGW-Firmicutes-1]
MDGYMFELREWNENDKDSITYYANNKKIADNLRNVFPNPYTEEHALFYIRMCLNESTPQKCVKAIVVDGKAVGSIGIFIKDDVYCKSAELGYWLGEEFWGKGIMTEAIKEICNYAFAKYDIVRIFAEPFAENQGSRRVLEKAGFELEGISKKSVFKNGKISDSCIYAITR